MEVAERSKDWTLRSEVDVVEKEKEDVLELKWREELRIGWVFWRLWRAFWRREGSGGLERRKPKTAVPVPPGTALHHVYSLPPTALPTVASPT